MKKSSLIIPLGRWIIDTAAAQCNEWVKIIPQFVMHINLSFVQIAKSNVIKDVIENINKYEAEMNILYLRLLKAYRWILILR